MKGSEPGLKTSLIMERTNFFKLIKNLFYESCILLLSMVLIPICPRIFWIMALVLTMLIIVNIYRCCMFISKNKNYYTNDEEKNLMECKTKLDKINHQVIDELTTKSDDIPVKSIIPESVSTEDKEEAHNEKTFEEKKISEKLKEIVDKKEGIDKNKTSKNTKLEYIDYKSVINNK